MLKRTMNCNQCHKEFALMDVLEKSHFAWSESAMVWYPCSECGAGNHIRFYTRGYGQIKMLSPQGVDWEVVNEFIEPSISIRQDPSYLHIWFNNRHYEFETR